MMDPNEGNNPSQGDDDNSDDSPPKDPSQARGYKRTATVAKLGDDKVDAAGKKINTGEVEQQEPVINEPVENAGEDGRGSPSSESSLEGIEFLINRTTLDDVDCERPDGRREPQQPWLDPSKLFGHIEEEDEGNEENVHTLRASAATPAPSILNPRVRIPPCDIHSAAFIAPPLRFKNYLSSITGNVPLDLGTGGAFTSCRFNTLHFQMFHQRGQEGQEARDEGIYEEDEPALNFELEMYEESSSEETQDSAVAIDEDGTISDDRDGGKDFDDSDEKQAGSM